ncbi:MAG: bifunctional diaminohydroxyphosphoribosylaminopyrimidine deaminase/5-amino-6-(5-phosphoribosylamino)uracil reductase RibD [Bryobacteraceae bacterium]|nr:bifunctional diaminohydroxyphosphoribosylaminopyrimidine deaminase/5-amino-6-(5-phosphoribosylamino)uracil reductase RibD [Bryobacterales bacterium]MEB2362817.1 bifunctional diaminohydroxyphosphoribosylaminopyrimidine deaminase/5-amino-6-(5-phosphoribosylamino)uracil reductase RibD [Bryobacterales bacterium]NUN01550.1 bifunctional diaminohydroxyphosphoribosylaminopyrimidine deaminase/5-amino-6-(5-phosphoribosylamino)uracil reductase RibD [Bryobacteraceae bacterium]
MNNDYMETALALAREGLGQTSPNPTVGAVLVLDGEIVGRGFHTYAGVKHAEVLALEEAGARARGATLYVTLEPCCHTGRTDPCTNALIAAGVERVVAAMEDPNPQVRGAGLRRLREAGIAVDLSFAHASEAAKLNEPFVHFIRTGLPLVTLKAAVTLDGKIAAPEDNRGWITSERARGHVQELRHLSDAILTGIGTVLGDDPLMTDRSGKPRGRPLLRIVLDSQLRIPPDSRMVAGCRSDLLIVTTSAASSERRKVLEERGCSILVADGPGGRTDLRALLDYLGRQNRYLSLMIEAGSKVNWAMLESGVVDKIFFYYAPKILGGLHSLPVVGGAGRLRRVDAIRFRNVSLHSIAPDEFAVEAYLVKEN